MKKWLVPTICTVILLGLTGLACASDVNLEVTVDRTRVSLGSSIQLSITFHGAQEVSAAELPDLEGFDWRYLGPSTRISIINGRASSSITHIYNLVALKTGVFTIPSFSVDYKGKTYASDPISVEVVKGPVRQSPSGAGQAQDAGAQNLEDRIFLIMQVDEKKAYINEIMPVTFKLYVDGLAIRDIQFPEFAHEGFFVDKFEQPGQYKEALHGISYDVIEFKTNIYGMRPGEFALGPATIRCNLIVRKQKQRSSVFGDDFFSSNVFDGFFDRYETHPLNLKSVDLLVTVMDLPQTNVPAEFDGTIGKYGFSLMIEPKQVKIGDPITVKMRIFGEGNLKTVKPPSLNFDSNDFKVYEPEVKQFDTGKAIEQVIIPKHDKVTQIPEIVFSYFDTKTGEYRRVVRGPVPIEVLPLAKDEELKIFDMPQKGEDLLRRREVLGRDIIYIKETPGVFRKKGRYLHRNRWFIPIQFIPIFAIIAVLVIQRKRERLATDVRYARRLRAPKKARKNILKAQSYMNTKDKDKFYDAVFKTLQEYLGDKFHLPTAGITSEVVTELASRGVNQDILGKLKNCFLDCDTARYAPSSFAAEEMQKTFRLLEEIIDALTRTKV